MSYKYATRVGPNFRSGMTRAEAYEQAVKTLSTHHHVAVVRYTDTLMDGSVEARLIKNNSNVLVWAEDVGRKSEVVSFLREIYG